jgi:hypothetical protein
LNDLQVQRLRLTYNTDDLMKVTALALMVAHVLAFVWAGVLRKKLAPVLALNLLVSAGVAIYWLPRLTQLFNYIDLVTAFVGFEFFVLATSLLAIAGRRVAPALIWLQFVAHSLLIAAALTFITTFKITRLI